MSAVIAGPVESVTVDGRLFKVSADADAGRNLGGFTSELLPNSDGSSRIKLSRKGWSIKGLSVQIDDEQEDQEFLCELAGRLVPISIKFANGFTYSGSGTVVSDVETKTASATADIELGGSGKLVKN